MLKFPRTHHVPYSPGVGSDDKVHKKPLPDLDSGYVMLEKMDGENTTFTKEFIHARSVNGYPPHWSRSYMKSLWAEARWLCPPNEAILGENLTGVHSIKYEDLPSFFLVFGIRHMRKDVPYVMGWAMTMSRLDMQFNGLLKTVPVIAHIPGNLVNDEKLIMSQFDSYRRRVGREVEGFVLRPANRFPFSEYTELVGKWVRPNHVQANEHWMESAPKFNGFPKP